MNQTDYALSEFRKGTNQEKEEAMFLLAMTNNSQLRKSVEAIVKNQQTILNEIRSIKGLEKKETIKTPKIITSV